LRTIQTDVAIIGAGTAGLNARRQVERGGKRWVMIESGPYGTTCARVGCMPSKLLIAAADTAHEVSLAGRFGIRVNDDAWSVDGEAVMDRVRAERDRFAGFVVADTEALSAEFRIRGRARFVAPTTLMVDEHTRVEASAVVIATGSSPWIPPGMEAVADRVRVNDDVFEWRTLPESVAVFGTGIIGLELGQALHRLGVRVTLFNPFDQLGPFSDPVVGKVAREVMGAELDLNLGAKVHSIEPHGDGVRVDWTTMGGERRTATFEHLLAAAGRRANLGGLGLRSIGVPLDKRGLPVSDERTLQLGDLPVFIAGDAAGHRPLLHEASDEGRIAGANAASFPHVSASIRRESLAVAFTNPQMGMVGKRFADLEPGSFVAGEVSYFSQGRARVMGINQGVVRIYAMKRRPVIVGAEMFGPRVEHTAHLVAWAVQQQLTVGQALGMPFYHPVIEEGVRTALRDACSKLQLTRDCPPEHLATAAGM
jgi:dihydrolipoamide dehydrogenase